MIYFTYIIIIVDVIYAYTPSISLNHHLQHGSSWLYILIPKDGRTNPVTYLAAFEGISYPCGWIALAAFETYIPLWLDGLGGV